MLKLLFLSDFHGSLTSEELDRLFPEPVDAVFLLGDIDYYELRKIDEYFMDVPKFGLHGNHDNPDYFMDTDILDLHAQVRHWNGLTLAGFGGCPVYKRPSFGQYEEEEVSAFTESLPAVDLFIAHANPMVHRSTDETDPHRGFQAFSDYIRFKQPTYFVHGHVHEPHVRKQGNTSVLSVYPSCLLKLPFSK